MSFDDQTKNFKTRLVRRTDSKCGNTVSTLREIARIAFGLVCDYQSMTKSQPRLDSRVEKRTVLKLDQKGT